MGYASYSEANSERYFDNMHMNQRLPMLTPEHPVAPEPLYVASPPIQPKMIVVSPAANDADAVEERQRKARQTHILALAELLPGKRWRH